jgi:hypothetical protein
MNTPPIFALCAANVGVTALLGSNPVRFFMFGMAPQNVQKPYAVWQVVAGKPENYLAGRPDAEGHTIQVDVYGDSASQTRSTLSAIEGAIELNCYITRYGGESRDPVTMNYRSTMDVDWISLR